MLGLALNESEIEDHLNEHEDKHAGRSTTAAAIVRAAVEKYQEGNGQRKSYQEPEEISPDGSKKLQKGTLFEDPY